MVRALTAWLMGVALLMATTVACTSTIDLQGVNYNYRRGDYWGAYEELQALQESYTKKQGPLLYALDAGMLAHYGQQYSESNLLLSAAERGIWENYSESITANIASYLVNDNTRAYQGEDFEDLYANIFKALNYLHLGEPESAMVELRRFTEKQQLLKQKYLNLNARLSNTSYGEVVEEYTSSQFSSSALGFYLQMVLARDIGEFDTAQYSKRALEESFKSQKMLYPFSIPSTVAEDLTPPAEREGRVNIVAFSGLSPYKEEVVERLPLSRTNYVKIALPRMVRRPTVIDSIEVVVSNVGAFKLELLEDMGTIAVDAFKMRENHIYNKTIIRALLKATGSEIIDYTTQYMYTEAQCQQEADTIAVIGTFLSFFSRIFSEASENADVRGSHYFPDKAWIGGVTLPYGSYDVRLLYRNRNGKIVYEDNLKGLTVTAKGLRLWESVCPL
ncbi:MAG: hypothetical protein WCY78_02000 [Sphaerochaetaceae bacterium]